MTEPGTLKVLRFCYFGNGSSLLADRVARVSMWCLTLAVLFFSASFRLLFEDGNLLVRGVATLVLSAPLLWLYARRKRSMIASAAQAR